MAENQTVFQSVLDIIRTDKGVKRPTSQDPAKNVFTPNIGGVSSAEDVQQQFLDWQVQKVAGDIYQRTIYFDTDRINSYHDYRAMDMSPEVTAALDIMRDECLVPNEYGEILQVYSPDLKVKEELEQLFFDRMDINFSLSLWIRELLKFGDYFIWLHTDKELGVYDFMVLPQEEVHREEGFNNDVNEVKFRWEGSNIYFEEWQIAHFRLIEDTRRLPYGRSVLDSARKLWKQLQLAEDAMLVYRTTRAPDRRVFYIEVGTLEEADVKQFMQNMQKNLKKQPMVNVTNGNVNFKYDPLNVTEDYFIPIRSDHHSRIDTLPGACLALDTRIPLLDGRTLELQEIIKEWNEGNRDLWVYSCDPKTGEVMPGPITWAGVTRKNTEVVKITLDNGESIVCTPDHKFPTRLNGMKEAQNLKEGESLWSFNKKFEPIFKNKKKAKSYEMVYDHVKNDWVYTHQMVARFMKNKGLHQEYVFNEEYSNNHKNTIHHYDIRHLNNNPNNLFFMSFHDHVMLHQSLSWKYKKERKKGIKEYWENISEEELETKRKVARKNFKKGSDKLQELLQDEDYKKEFYEKTSAALKIAKNKPEYKAMQREIAKEQWKNGNIRQAVKEKQAFKYSDELLKYVVDLYKEGYSAVKIIDAINKKGSWFMNELTSLNKGNRQMKKMRKFTHNNLYKMMMHFGYDNWRDFKNKAENYNHRITKIEWLDAKQDTGTITVDGKETLQSTHTFALESGIYTKNSNLGEIQDIEYLQNKLFASLKVPKPYLNYADNIPGGATLSQADIRFARTINRFQEIILLELRKIAKVHLALKGMDGQLNNFSLKLNNPSTQQELMKLEIMKGRLEVGKDWHSLDANSFASWTWVMEVIMGFSKQDIKTMLRQKKIEKKLFAEIDAAPETYRKTGLFRELDKKFEVPNADPMGGKETEDGGGEGFGGSSALGGEFGDESMGGGDDAGFDAGGGGGAPPTDFGGGDEAPSDAGGDELSESRFTRRDKAIMDKLLKMSDDRFDDVLDKLLEVNEPEPEPPTLEEKADEIEEKSNDILNRTDKMLKRMEDKLVETEGFREGLKQINDDSPLFKSYNSHVSNISALMEELEQQMEEDEPEVLDAEIVEDVEKTNEEDEGTQQT